MATSNGWDSYIWQIQNSFSAKKQTYMKMNVCEHAAIIGNDGTPWATTSNWPELTEYEYDLETDEPGVTQKIKVNEHKAALMASTGNRNPTAAGVRMGGMKFIFLNHDPSANLV